MQVRKAKEQKEQQLLQAMLEQRRCIDPFR
jgi:hypothetical protein